MARKLARARKILETEEQFFEHFSQQFAPGTVDLAENPLRAFAMEQAGFNSADVDILRAMGISA
jgi:hypothetical protein